MRQEGSPNPQIAQAQYDGSGYPEGLRGEEIPVEVRVLSVVDVADAIRHDRAYRPGCEVPEVLSFVEAQAGTQFDPAIASAFLRLVKERPDVFARPGPSQEQ